MADNDRFRVKANRIKKDLKRIDRENNNLFSNGRSKHEKKVKYLKSKVNATKPKEKTGKEWIALLADGKPGAIPPHPIPVYGTDLNFDEDEKAALRVPPDFPTMGTVSRQNGKYECLLTRTKVRYSRRTGHNIPLA